MGVLYIKVIETRKVAVQSSFFVNYPFVQLSLDGKDTKKTSYRPGIEWWDTIFSFRVRKETDHLLLRVQARDKSIHVFGSDWLGETSIDIKTFCDGDVHQMWYQFGKGRRIHSRPPRGFVHLAFHYITDADVTLARPFARPPIEPVLCFDEWLAQDHAWIEKNGNNVGNCGRGRLVNSQSSSTTSDALNQSSEDISSSSASHSSYFSTNRKDGNLIDLSFDNMNSDSKYPSDSKHESSIQSPETPPKWYTEQNDEVSSPSPALSSPSPALSPPSPTLSPSTASTLSPSNSSTASTTPSQPNRLLNPFLEHVSMDEWKRYCSSSSSATTSPSSSQSSFLSPTHFSWWSEAPSTSTSN